MLSNLCNFDKHAGLWHQSKQDKNVLKNWLLYFGKLDLFVEHKDFHIIMERPIFLEIVCEFIPKKFYEICSWFPKEGLMVLKMIIWHDLIYLDVCVYICVCVCMCVSVFVCVCVCMGVCPYLYVCVCIWISCFACTVCIACIHVFAFKVCLSMYNVNCL